jgi:hypothetical protein
MRRGSRIFLLRIECSAAKLWFKDEQIACGTPEWPQSHVIDMPAGVCECRHNLSKEDYQ